jgi:hypothetical protein
MARKILTIGITINLENYENLRLEVQGEIMDEGSTEEIISFLDGMLTRLGHGDQVTAERVEAYRRRVLTMPGSGEAISGTVVREVRLPPEAARPAPATGPAREPVAGPREPEAVEARPETPPETEEKPVTVRVTPDTRAAKPVARPAARAEGSAPARVSERKAPASQPPKEAAREAAKPERPVIAEGEVPCEGCGASITKTQEKLSRLLTGKSLCKRCMNAP